MCRITWSWLLHNDSLPAGLGTPGESSDMLSPNSHRIPDGITACHAPTASIFLSASLNKSIFLLYFPGFFPVLYLLPGYFCVSFIGITPNLHIFEIVEVEKKVTEINLLLPEFSVRWIPACLNIPLFGKAHQCDLLL